MSDIEHDAPSGVNQEPPERSDQDREFAQQLVAEVNEEGRDLVGPDGVLTGLTKRVLKAGREARDDRASRLPQARRRGRMSRSSLNFVE